MTGVFFDALDEAITFGDAFVERRVAEAHRPFASASRRGGAERAARRRRWFDAHRHACAARQPTIRLRSVKPQGRTTASVPVPGASSAPSVAAASRSDSLTKWA